MAQNNADQSATPTNTSDPLLNPSAQYNNASSPFSEQTQGSPSRRSGGLGMLLRHADDFDLTEEQIQQLEALRVASELEKVDLQAALRKANICLDMIMRNVATASDKEVLDAIDLVTKSEGDLRKKRFYNLRKAQAILNDAQKGKIMKFKRSQDENRIKKSREQNQGQRNRASA